jgi:multimeric flavodoxin WrbA
MKRLALNGSPRGANSNSRKILSWIFEGMSDTGADAPPVLDLARTKDVAGQREAFLDSGEVLLVFPLYTDSVPGVLKNFLDSLAGADPRRLAGKRFAFIVQSGFPESIQSEPVVAYLKRLSDRLGLRLVGAAIRGNSEGLRLMPAKMTEKARGRFIALGRSLVRDGGFDPEIVRQLAVPRRFGFIMRLVMAVLIPFGLPNFYWNMMLKKNGVWERRFDQPYQPAAVR